MRLTAATTTLVGVLLLAGSTLAGGGPRTKVEVKTSNGAHVPGDSNMGEISPNGRYLAFNSSAAELPGTAGGTISQVFLRDRKTGKVKLISKTTGGDPADGTSEDASVSANGRRVVFESEANNLPGEGVDEDQVYVRDLKTKRTKLVSRTTGGDPADDESFDGSISAGGRFVVFDSTATNLPGGSGPLDQQCFIHDIKRGTTKRLSRTSSGAPATGEADNPFISANGRIAIFESNADNLPGTGDYQVYTRDMKTGKTKVVSKTSAGAFGDGDSFDALLSDNGRYVGFASDADNLPGANPSGYWEAYVHDRKTGKTRLVSRTSGGDPADGGDSQNPYPLNGRFVLLESDGANMPGDDTQVYLRDLKRNRTTLISRNNAGEAADDGGDIPRNRVLTAKPGFAFFDAAGANMPGDEDQVFSRGPLP